MEEAVDGVLKQMAEDLAQKTDETNQKLNDFLDNLMEAEAEAIDHIDELPSQENNVFPVADVTPVELMIEPSITHNTDKPKQSKEDISKRQKAIEKLTLLKKGNESAQTNSSSSAKTDYVAFSAGALTASAVVALGLYFVRRTKQTADEEDEGFHRV